MAGALGGVGSWGSTSAMPNLISASSPPKLEHLTALAAADELLQAGEGRALDDALELPHKESRVQKVRTP